MKQDFKSEFSKGTRFLADGGLETSMIFHEGLDLPQFASFTLLDKPEGRAALNRYFDKCHKAAVESGMAFILDTATWRANPDWGKALGLSADDILSATTQAVEFAKETRKRWSSGVPVYICGVAGPQGDGYNPDSFMSAQEAEAYHGPQVAKLAESGVDFISAITMCYPNEAIGIAQAAKKAGMECVVSFTVETDGHLISGYSLKEAIEIVEEATDDWPVFYMINCAHPDHFDSVVRTDASWLSRIGGIRANASRMSHEELDNAEELDPGNPAELAEQYRDLTTIMPKLAVFGGCCGTDHRHVSAIGHACTHHRHAA